jgi:hypothetical protein
MSRLRVLLAVGALAGLAACDRDRPADVTAPEELAPALRAAPSDPTPNSIALRKVGGYVDGRLAAAEITSFDHVSRRLFVVNGAIGTVDVLDLRNPANPRKIATIGRDALGGGAANSVDTHNGVVAIAVEAVPKTANGTVFFFRATTLQQISQVTVGALPDMLTFTPDGKTVLVANEGEPNADYSIDPEGSISVVDVTNVNAPSARSADFRAWIGREDELRAQGVRIYGPGANAAQDFEPEYITVAEDGRTAWVSLQENNALAVVDIASASVTDILPLGYKDHSMPGNELDASDRDGPGRGGNSQGRLNVRNWPVFGIYQPDAIASYTVAGQTYIVTANEGDAREYDTFAEEARVSALPLNPATFSDGVCGGPCKDEDQFGRLTVTTTLGFNTATGVYDALYTLGGRSVSIWSADGRQVWDSGSEFERRTAMLPNVAFNASNTGNAFDDRSDNKGPEPEGVVLGTLGARTFAFIGLERVGGIMVYDVSTPTAPFFVTYVNSRNGAAGDRGPEGLTFVPAVRSPNKRPLLIVGNETSGSVAVYEIELQ